jgi:hypothetical protein
MKPWLKGLLWSSFAFVGCAQHVFPPDVVDGIDPAFDFARWRAAPTLVEPVQIQLGGRILETLTIGGTVTIVAAELAIVRFPAYGPKQGKSKGSSA